MSAKYIPIDKEGLKRMFKAATGYYADVHPRKYYEWIEDYLISIENTVRLSNSMHVTSNIGGEA